MDVSQGLAPQSVITLRFHLGRDMSKNFEISPLTRALYTAFYLHTISSVLGYLERGFHIYMYL